MSDWPGMDRPIKSLLLIFIAVALAATSIVLIKSICERNMDVEYMQLFVLLSVWVHLLTSDKESE